VSYYNEKRKESSAQRKKNIKKRKATQMIKFKWHHFATAVWHKARLEPRVYLFGNLIIIPVHFASPKHAKDTWAE